MADGKTEIFTPNPSLIYSDCGQQKSVSRNRNYTLVKSDGKWVELPPREYIQAKTKGKNVRVWSGDRPLEPPQIPPRAQSRPSTREPTRIHPKINRHVLYDAQSPQDSDRGRLRTQSKRKAEEVESREGRFLRSRSPKKKPNRTFLLQSRSSTGVQRSMSRLQELSVEMGRIKHFSRKFTYQKTSERPHFAHSQSPATARDHALSSPLQAQWLLDSGQCQRRTLFLPPIPVRRSSLKHSESRPNRLLTLRELPLALRNLTFEERRDEWRPTNVDYRGESGSPKRSLWWRDKSRTRNGQDSPDPHNIWSSNGSSTRNTIGAPNVHPRSSSTTRRSILPRHQHSKPREQYISKYFPPHVSSVMRYKHVLHPSPKTALSEAASMLNINALSEPLQIVEMNIPAQATLRDAISGEVGDGDTLEKLEKARTLVEEIEAEERILKLKRKHREIREEIECVMKMRAP
ncbi:hypothetical protein BGZ60DRAFT_528884 [Tricladium varicosporioides]|nr:hypothetical protein BGZ60DRAFT_528884 [Hymenoscyphus varicosporioides]